MKLHVCHHQTVMITASDLINLRLVRRVSSSVRQPLAHRRSSTSGAWATRLQWQATVSDQWEERTARLGAGKGAKAHVTQQPMDLILAAIARIKHQA